jgi:hypothetical protein
VACSGGHGWLTSVGWVPDDTGCISGFSRRAEPTTGFARYSELIAACADSRGARFYSNRRFAPRLVVPRFPQSLTEVCRTSADQTIVQTTSTQEADTDTDMISKSLASQSMPLTSNEAATSSDSTRLTSRCSLSGQTNAPPTFKDCSYLPGDLA